MEDCSSAFIDDITIMIQQLKATLKIFFQLKQHGILGISRVKPKLLF
jgi:hypothetical protein